jgi:hypothetical protein
MENTKEYRCVDLYIGASILAAKLPLLRLEHANHNQCAFIFDASPAVANEIILRHWGRELLLPSRDLIEAISELKTRIHSGV